MTRRTMALLVFVCLLVVPVPFSVGLQKIAPTSEGTMTATISSFDVDGTTRGQDLKYDGVFGKKSIYSPKSGQGVYQYQVPVYEAGDYGKTAAIVYCGDAYMARTEPIAKFPVDFVENGTTKRLEYLEYEYFTDVIIRSAGYLEGKPMREMTVKAWEVDYVRHVDDGKAFGNFITTKHYDFGGIHYTPWNVTAAAGAIECDVKVLIESKPYTFGSALTTQGYELQQTWTGITSVKVQSSNSGLINVTDEYSAGRTTETTETAEYAASYGLEDAAASFHTSDDDAGEDEMILEISDQTATFEERDYPDGRLELQGYYATPEAFGALPMRDPNTTTLVDPIILNPDLRLNQARPAVEVNLQQRIAPQLTLYKNRLSYYYQRVDMEEWLGQSGAVCLWQYDPLGGCGDLFTYSVTEPTLKYLDYPRAAQIRNCYVKYTLRFTAIQVFDWTKVNFNYSSTPVTYGGMLNESLLIDDFYVESAGGIETIATLPPPGMKGGRIENPGETFGDVVGDLTGDLVDAAVAVIGIVVAAVVVYVAVKFVTRRKKD